MVLPLDSVLNELPDQALSVLAYLRNCAVVGDTWASIRLKMLFLGSLNHCHFYATCYNPVRLGKRAYMDLRCAKVRGLGIEAGLRRPFGLQKDWRPTRGGVLQRRL